MVTPPNDVPDGALDGLVVLDLTQMLAGPFASMMLADQGATVIKIEPLAGDKTRRIGPHLPGALAMAEGGSGAYFSSINRNKRSLALDLKSETGKQVLRRLVAKSDALIENFRGGVMERLGLAYESLAEINPRLVYVSVRGFGDRRGGESPYASWPAYDPVSQAMGGVMGITGRERGGPPTKVGPGIGDTVPSMFSAFGLVCACWRAQRTGEGQYVDVGMVDSILALCERMVFQYSVTGVSPGPEGNGHPLLCPFGLFPARDGFVSLGVPRDDFWEPFVELMGRPDLATDPRFATNDARLERAEETLAIVSAWTSARTRAEIADVLGGTIPFGPVYRAEDIFGDPHFAARAMLAEVESPGADRALTIAGTPVKMTGTPGGVRRRAPLCGEHSREILGEFGFASEEIDQLVGENVVGLYAPPSA